MSEQMKVGDPIEMVLTDVDAVAGRVLGLSRDHETVFVEIRLARSLGAVRLLPNLPLPSPSSDPVYRCTFCGKSNGEVVKMIATDDQGKTCICNECVGVCVEIIEEDKSKQ